MDRHKWNKSDDILTYFISKYGEENNITIDNICSSQNIKTRSFQQRVKNFNALAGKPNGLSHAAKLSIDVFKEYKSISKETHKEHCLAILKQNK